MTSEMTDPIPVSDAIRACERLIAICDAASSEPWAQDDDCRVFAESVPDRIHEFGFNPRIVCETEQQRDQAGADMDFIVAARATLKPLTRLALLELRNEYGPDESMGHLEALLYPSIAAIIAHLEQTEPDWRTE